LAAENPNREEKEEEKNEKKYALIYLNPKID
jgi:hypothetical protein